MKLLLSIKPPFAEKILDGSKRFEFRRRIPKDSRVDTVVIYATLPVGKVVGEFSIKQIHSEHPDELWERTKKFSGISRQYYDDYFQGRRLAHAIEADSPRRYRRPRDISELLPSGAPPQSFAYLSRQGPQ